MINPAKHAPNPARTAKRSLLLVSLAICGGCQSAKVRTASIPSDSSSTVFATEPLSNPDATSGNVRLAALRIEAAGENGSRGAGESGSEKDGENGSEGDEGLSLTPSLSDSLTQDSLTQDSLTQDSLTPTSLETLIATALTTHPSIAAARQNVAAIRHRYPQATALEDPVVGNTFWPIHDQALQTAGGRIGHQFSLSQKVPWPEKLDARGAVVAREVQVALAEVQKAELEVIESIRLAYHQLWLADELMRIVGDNTELVEDLITVSEARYKTGGSQQDVLRAELEGDRIDERLIALRQQKEQARADLGALVRQPLAAMPTAVRDLNIDQTQLQIETLVADAEACNPTLKGLAAEIARDRAKESLACLQQYPDFQLGVGYSIVSDDHDVLSPVANGHDNINFSLGVTLPIWRDKINAGFSEAAHARSATTLRREAEQDRLRGTLRRQVAAAYAATEQLELFEERLIPRTEQTLDITAADYQGKKADFTDLVASYRDLLALQVQVARTKATLAGTIANIERTVGCRTIQ